MTALLESASYRVNRFLHILTTMRFVVFLTLALGPHAYGQCLPPEQIREILANLEAYAVKVDLPGSGDDGSGFLLRSNLGVEAVTAHHVVVDDRDQQPASCEGSDEVPADATKLLASTFNFHRSQPVPRLPIQFPTRAPHFSVEHDLVKMPLPGTSFRGLEPQPAERPLAQGEEIVIAGYPVAKNRGFMRHRCEFKGYGEGLNTTDHSAYELHCPNVDYDLAAMSGGIAVSTCTGKVVGAVSYQDYHVKCPDSGDPRSVYVAPLIRNQAGQIAFGPPKVRALPEVAHRVLPSSQTQFILGHGVR